MGNQSSHSGKGLSADLTGLTTDWPIQFHEVHGDNVALSPDKSRARRADSFCKSICFSNRPIGVNERVYLRFVQMSNSWSGVLRFGFTSMDPGSVNGSDLPRYACPDMTNKPGNWAKALGERYSAINNVLHFWYNRNGDVMYGINGEDIGLFFTGVTINTPLWALMDIYGNTIEIEFMKLEPPLLNNMLNRPSISMPAEISAITSAVSALTTSASETALPSNNTVVQANSLPIKHYTMARFSLMQWHKLQGKNIQITDPNRTVASRSPEEYCNGYVFSSRPLKCGEKIVLQVLGIDRSYVGGLAVGFTTCSPDSVSQSDLPDDADLLLDRMEYWVVNKDVYRSPEIGDELCFHLTNDGEVRYSRNNSKITTLMHVDRTLPLWIFFDIYGNIQKIRCLGVAPHQPPVPPRPRSTSYLTQGPPIGVALPRPERTVQPMSQNAANAHVRTQQQNQAQVGSMVRSFSSPSGVHAKSSPPVPPKSHSVSTPTSPSENSIPESETHECTVCYEREVNSVLYKCGHVCMCFECAIHVKEKGALCPICRQTIHDVIKIYKT